MKYGASAKDRSVRFLSLLYVPLNSKRCRGHLAVNMGLDTSAMAFGAPRAISFSCALRHADGILTATAVQPWSSTRMRRKASSRNMQYACLREQVEASLMQNLSSVPPSESQKRVCAAIRRGGTLHCWQRVWCKKAAAYQGFEP